MTPGRDEGGEFERKPAAVGSAFDLRRRSMQPLTRLMLSIICWMGTAILRYLPSIFYTWSKTSVPSWAAFSGSCQRAGYSSRKLRVWVKGASCLSCSLASRRN